MYMYVSVMTGKGPNVVSFVIKSSRTPGQVIRDCPASTRRGLVRSATGWKQKLTRNSFS